MTHDQLIAKLLLAGFEEQDMPGWYSFHWNKRHDVIIYIGEVHSPDGDWLVTSRAEVGGGTKLVKPWRRPGPPYKRCWI